MRLAFLSLLLCGLTEATAKDKRGLTITCGREAKPNEIPWQVGLAGDINNRKFPYCGGSLYTNNTVITAAHCISKNSTTPLWIRSGSLSKTDASAQWVQVETAVIHSDYKKTNDPNAMDNDIALLRLKTNVWIDNASKPIPLLEESAPTDSFQRCIVSGWGREHSRFGNFEFFQQEDFVNATGMVNGEGPDELRLTYIYPEFNTSICQSMYDAAYPHINFTIAEDTEFCAGWMGCADSCQGDSGGPLACLRKGSKEYELTGVVSWGGYCGNSAAPGFYASIPHFKPWIEECTAALDEGIETADCEFIEKMNDEW